MNTTTFSSIKQDEMASLNSNLLKQVKETVGLNCFETTKLFDSWLWFERYLIYPIVFEKINKPQQIEWEKLDKNFFPRWAVADRQAGYLFRQFVEVYWHLTLAEDLPYRIVFIPDMGLGVISRTNNRKALMKKLVGFVEDLSENEEMWNALVSSKYNSLIDYEKRHILFGPMQYINHECKADLGLQLRKEAFVFLPKFKGRELKIDCYDLIYEHEDPNAADQTKPVEKDKQVFISYSFNCRDYGLFHCICRLCKNDSLKIS